MTPHPFQQDYLKDIADKFEQFRKLLVISPTGSGKTCMFSWLADSFLKRVDEEGEPRTPSRVLILVDQDELVWQTVKKVQDICGVKADVEKAEHEASLEAKVVIGSVQTMMRDKRRASWPKDHFGLLIADEADKSVAPSWQSVLNHFDAHARVCGFTATPNRTDQKNLGCYYEDKIERENLVTLIKKKFLAPLSIQMLPIKLDVAGMGDGKDFTDAEADDIITPHLEQIALEIKKRTAFRRTLVFLPLIKTCEKFTGIARDIGMHADYVYGVDPERDPKIQRFRNFEFDVLANSMLLTRGVDIPEVDCIVPCRPTKSVTLYFQMVGRGTRLAAGKEDCLLLDFLYQASKKLICRPAHLIAGNQDEAEQITEILEGGGMPADVAEQMDLIDVASDATSQREDALRKKLEEQKKKNAKFISAEAFALQHHKMDVAEYEPTMPWHSEGISEKQAKYLEKAGIDVSTVKGKGQASELLGLYFNNKALTLASYGQRKKMAQMGHPNAWQATDREARLFFAELNNKRAA